MKVALLISGFLRSYDLNLKFIKEEIINSYEHVDTYLHITKDEKHEDRYFNLIEDVDIKKIIDELCPRTVVFENSSIYSTNKLANSAINHWKKLYELNELKKINEQIDNVPYDLVIRYRPDMFISTKNIFFNYKKEENIIYIPEDSKIDKKKLTNKSDGYICDALAFGNTESMNRYFDIYKNINDLILKFGEVSETILYNYINNNNINYKLLNIDYKFILSKCNTFAICGDSGSGKSTLSNLLKKTFANSFTLECDRYHKWERSNKNWEQLTHLNPDANYITKMNEDIFNLKIGNDIYQVDYNHNTGMFTEKQLINSSNNLIVCGLHSLHGSNNSLYNLKIFMDTDENLKKKWKIKRDHIERGYSIEKVLENISKREKDFNDFILPQKQHADLIIRFFTNENIDLYDIEKDYKLSLELTISNKFNIDNILKQLQVHKTKSYIEHGNDFSKVTFFEYEYLKALDTNMFPITKSFYDYIMFFILKLTFK